MTSRSPAPFAERLALARQMVARRAAQPPVHLADQLGAAGREVRQIHDRLIAVLPTIEPGRNWRQRLDNEPSDETRALLLASLLGCQAICTHLRRGGPRPAIARLALRRVDCQRCVQTLHRPATGADECDVCESPETLTFFPFSVRQGPLMLVGDACGTCARTLGILFAEAAS
jgi:hypothetical protein